MNIDRKIKMNVVHFAQAVDEEGMFLVVLQESGGERVIPLLINAEAAPLMHKAFMQADVNAVPMAEAMTGLTEAFNVFVQDVLITHIERGEYRAQVAAYQDGTLKFIAMRASDAILMSAFYRCPIYIYDSLLTCQHAMPASSGKVAIPCNVLTEKLLRDALEQAIEAENYELAKNIRDELNRRK